MLQKPTRPFSLPASGHMRRLEIKDALDLISLTRIFHQGPVLEVHRAQWIPAQPGLPGLLARLQNANGKSGDWFRAEKAALQRTSGSHTIRSSRSTG